jgi:hypothetical protein
MSKQKFNALALDQILADALEDTQELTSEIVEFDSEQNDDDDIVPAPSVSPNLNNLISPTTRSNNRL